MAQFKYVVTDPVGIHARPAGQLVKEIKGYDSTVTLTNEAGKVADGKKLMQIMGLGIKQGQTVIVDVEGGDAEGNAAKLQAFFEANF